MESKLQPAYSQNSIEASQLLCVCSDIDPIPSIYLTYHLIDPLVFSAISTFYFLHCWLRFWSSN